MSFMRFLTPRREAPAGPDIQSETEAVRRIVARLEAMPPQQARFLAATAYVMARSANADLHIGDGELKTI